MKVRLDLALDFEGHHTLEWEPSNLAGSIEVPKATLERWALEREAFRVAALRWKRVIEEVEDTLYRTEQDRVSAQDRASAQSRLATVVGAKARNVRRR
jgi:hypothetical protein